jgi:hypothetical protein
MTDEQLIAAADLVLHGEDQEAARDLALEIGRALIREMAATYARKILKGDVPPPPMVHIVLEPKPAEVTVKLHQAEQPKRTKRTVVTKHDERGRIVEFEQEDVA